MVFHFIGCCRKYVGVVTESEDSLAIPHRHIYLMHQILGVSRTALAVGLPCTKLWLVGTMDDGKGYKLQLLLKGFQTKTRLCLDVCAPKLQAVAGERRRKTRTDLK